MEDQVIQQNVKTRKRPLSPEKELLRRFGKLPKVKLPDFNSMEKDKIISWIDQHYRSKEVLTGFIKSVYVVVQQIYFEEFNLNPSEGVFSFPLLEGTVKVDTGRPIDEQYIFIPNKTLETLLIDSEQKGATKLKEFLDSRFYRMIEALYKLYN